MTVTKKKKISVGQAVQICPNANTKNAGKFGTVKAIKDPSGRYYGPSEKIYVIDLGENRTAELMADKIIVVADAEAKVEEKLEEKYFVISTDGKFTSKPLGYAKAIEMAKEKQLSTPDAPNYFVAKVIQKTTTPKTVVDMVSV